MNRKSREVRLETEERWPTLYQFLAGYLHQDWGIDHGSPAGAVDAAIVDYPLSRRQQLLREWRIWNGDKGAAFDPRLAVNEGLGVNVHFEEPADARQFMNMVYEKLIASVRSETSKDWKP